VEPASSAEMGAAGAGCAVVGGGQQVARE
jgi:hypothetical protein